MRFVELLSEVLTDDRWMGCCSTLACCEDHRFVAVSNDTKKLTVWDTRAGRADGSWVCLLERETSKKLNALRFVRRYHGVEAGSGSIGLVVADRMGDVYLFHIAYDLADAAGAEGPRTDASTDFLAGHLSTVTAMDFTADESFMITAERDEKIRVSHFPNSYNIESFCLGHTCHVSALAVATVEQGGAAIPLLLSGAVDGSLKLWSLPGSEPLYSLLLEQPRAAADDGPTAVVQSADNRPARKPHHVNEETTHDGVVAVDAIAYSAAAGVSAVSFSGCAICSVKSTSRHVNSKRCPIPFALWQSLRLVYIDLRRSRALAIVVIQPVASSASGDGASPTLCYKLVLSQWVELQHPPSTSALTFGGPDGSTLFVGAVGEEAPAVFSRQNGAFVSAV
jgi:WD40 repeat protein